VVVTSTVMSDATLQSIPLDRIDRNSENPRLVFRTGELDQLTDSIRQYGVQVPIAVYKEGRRYVLIDGERRWLCSMKLNKAEIPAIVQSKPDPLHNLLLMFNIHALREQWDLLTIALKLPRIIALLAQDGVEANEKALAERTGLGRAVIRRSRLLLDLPSRYRDMILADLKKPKRAQKLSEDLFIEMERALHVVEAKIPTAITDKDAVRDALLEKYDNGVIANIVQFRQLAKIARVDRDRVDEKRVRFVLSKVFQRNDYSIERAYNESVSEAYDERDLITRIRGLLDRLGAFDPDDVDDDLRQELISLVPHLHQTADLAKRHFATHFGVTESSFEVEQPIDAGIAFTPTFQVSTREKYLIVIEVAEGISQGTLGAAILQIRSQELPIKVCVAIPEGSQAASFKADLRFAKSHGIGLFEIGHAKLEAYQQPLLQNLAGVRRPNLGEFPKALRSPVGESLATFEGGNPRKGCSTITDEIEAISRKLANIQAKSGALKSMKKVGSTTAWARIMGALQTDFDDKDSVFKKIGQPLLARVAGLTTHRNQSNHPPGNIRARRKIDRELRTRYEHACDVLLDFSKACPRSCLGSG
jgi:ParB family chromosome partitioning protein